MIPLTRLPNSSDFFKVRQTSPLALPPSPHHSQQVLNSLRVKTAKEAHPNATKEMFQFSSQIIPSNIESADPLTAVLDLYTAGAVLQRLESLLEKNDQTSFQRLTEEILPPLPPLQAPAEKIDTAACEVPTIDISRVVVSGLKDVGKSPRLAPLIPLPPPP
jgi:hypothetical protein